MEAHKHKINREKFFAEMGRRGWTLDPNGWIIPEGRRRADQEADWYDALLMSIECECPYAETKASSAD